MYMPRISNASNNFNGARDGGNNNIKHMFEIMRDTHESS